LNNIAKGGKSIYGFSIGILMLNAKFPRIPGEMGNASTWDFPVLYKVVKSASPKKVVTENDPNLLEPFINAAKELEAEGVSAITTNCGFLAMFQKEMNEAVNIPLFSSTLMMVPLVYSMIRADQKVGIMTVNKTTLSDKIIDGAGCTGIPKVIVGMEDEEEFTNMILEDRLQMDVGKCREEHANVAKRLVAENPDVGAIVLECTNMPPYSPVIQQVTGLPVFDIVTYVNFMQHALVKKVCQGIM